MGCGRASSAAISSPTRRWAPVSGNGNRSSKAAAMPSGEGTRATAVWVAVEARRRASAVCRTNASSNRNRSCPRARWARSRGRCTASSAASGGSNPSAAPRRRQELLHPAAGPAAASASSSVATLARTTKFGQLRVAGYSGTGASARAPASSPSSRGSKTGLSSCQVSRNFPARPVARTSEPTGYLPRRGPNWCGWP